MKIQYQNMSKDAFQQENSIKWEAITTEQWRKESYTDPEFLKQFQIR